MFPWIGIYHSLCLITCASEWWWPSNARWDLLYRPRLNTVKQFKLLKAIKSYSLTVYEEWRNAKSSSFQIQPGGPRFRWQYKAPKCKQQVNKEKASNWVPKQNSPLYWCLNTKINTHPQTVKGASLCSLVRGVIASIRMTSPEKSPGRACTCACVCACMCQKAWIKSSLFIWCDSTQQRLHKDVPTPAPSLTLQGSKTCNRWPRMHSLLLQDMPPWPPNLFNLCNALAPHSPLWLCRGPTVSDTQSPSVTLTFHLHKDRHDRGLAQLPPHFCSCLTCF